MAKKKGTQTSKKTKTTTKAVNPARRWRRGEIIYLPFAELPGDVLGREYQYEGATVRLVYLDEEASKLKVM